MAGALRSSLGASAPGGGGGLATGAGGVTKIAESDTSEKLVHVSILFMSPCCLASNSGKKNEEIALVDVLKTHFLLFLSVFEFIL